MSKLNREWVVEEHEDPVELDEGLLTVAGTIAMPLGKFPRRMTVIAVKGGGTAIWSAIPLAEPAMKRIEELGSPKFLIVPNAGHRLDLAAWKTRYPDAKVIAPPGAKEKVAEAAPVDATGDLIGDPALGFGQVAGTKLGEFFLTVKRPGGTTLILNDILSNVAHPDGIGAKVMARLFGFGVDHPRTSRLVRRMYVDDDAAVARQFRDWTAMPGLRRIVVSHGDLIERDPAAVLERAAADFD